MGKKRIKIKITKENYKFYIALAVIVIALHFVSEFISKNQPTDQDIAVGGIEQLNTEKEVFLEGTNMHHCLYNCYWNRIKSKDYIAFHMSVPEDCTFSFKVLNDKVVLDQAFLAYDKQISDITKTAIVDFQNRNEADLYKLLTGENMAYWPEEIDLPY